VIARESAGEKEANRDSITEQPERGRMIDSDRWTEQTEMVRTERRIQSRDILEDR
jgi:hypothetical protein